MTGWRGNLDADKAVCLAGGRVADKHPEKKDLFSDMVSDVRPLEQDRISPYRPGRSSTPAQRLADEQRVMQELLDDPPDEASIGSGDEISWLKNGYPRKLLRDLRRGRYTVQDEIDLHGHTVPEARAALNAFLADCVARRIGCVRVIHGKGRGSPGRIPVLKGKVAKWLATNDSILAVCSAPSSDGGQGAVYVLIRR